MFGFPWGGRGWCTDYDEVEEDDLVDSDELDEYNDAGGHEFLARPVRATHTKPCTDCGCGFDDGDWYYTDEAEHWTQQDKLCSSCMAGRIEMGPDYMEDDPLPFEPDYSEFAAAWDAQMAAALAQQMQAQAPARSQSSDRTEPIPAATEYRGVRIKSEPRDVTDDAQSRGRTAAAPDGRPSKRVKREAEAAPDSARRGGQNEHMRIKSEPPLAPHTPQNDRLNTQPARVPGGLEGRSTAAVKREAASRRSGAPAGAHGTRHEVKIKREPQD